MISSGWRFNCCTPSLHIVCALCISQQLSDAQRDLAAKEHQLFLHADMVQEAARGRALHAEEIAELKSEVEKLQVENRHLESESGDIGVQVEQLRSKTEELSQKLASRTAEVGRIIVGLLGIVYWQYTVRQGYVAVQLMSGLPTYILLRNILQRLLFFCISCTICLKMAAPTRPSLDAVEAHTGVALIVILKFLLLSNTHLSLSTAYNSQHLTI